MSLPADLQSVRFHFGMGACNHQSLSARCLNLVLGICAVYACIAGCGQNLASRSDNFKTLDEQLQNATSQNEFEFGSAAYFQSPAVRRVVGARTRDELLLMAQQQDYCLLAIVAFHEIKMKFPRSAFDVAVEMIAKTERPGFLLYAPMYEYLAALPNDAATRKRLDVIEKITPRHIVNLDVLANAFDEDLLRDWFHERQGHVDQPWMAVVLSKLYSQRRVAPTATMERALEACGQDSGFPRLTYLYLQDRVDEIYLKRLRGTLEDPSLPDDDIRIMARHCRHCRDAITTSIDLDTLELSDERRGLIERAIKEGEDADR